MFIQIINFLNYLSFLNCQFGQFPHLPPILLTCYKGIPRIFRNAECFYRQHNHRDHSSLPKRIRLCLRICNTLHTYFLFYNCKCCNPNRSLIASCYYYLSAYLFCSSAIYENSNNSVSARASSIPMPSGEPVPLIQASTNCIKGLCLGLGIFGVKNP